MYVYIYTHITCRTVISRSGAVRLALTDWRGITGGLLKGCLDATRGGLGWAGVGWGGLGWAGVGWGGLGWAGVGWGGLGWAGVGWGGGVVRWWGGEVVGWWGDANQRDEEMFYWFLKLKGLYIMYRIWTACNVLGIKAEQFKGVSHQTYSLDASS